MRILVTGGAGFIGSHLLKYLVYNYPHYEIVNVDTLTYAGSLENLHGLEVHPNYRFIKLDITDGEFVSALFRDMEFDAVIHLAAESHVDRSIHSPVGFIQTNVLGTFHLLEGAKKQWLGCPIDSKCFIHVSTDEVYGSLGETGVFTEESPYDPRSPYSASKASSDHLAFSYFHTYDLPVIVTHCSNNYGTHQHPEKFIPTVIQSIVNGTPIPVYGDGTNVRDWIWVGDHVRALDAILHGGHGGETYNIGSDNEWRNIDLVRLICRKTDEILGEEPGRANNLIRFVVDRSGHDYRYAISSKKISQQLDWKPVISFEEGLEKTIRFYLGIA